MLISTPLYAQTDQRASDIYRKAAQEIIPSKSINLAANALSRARSVSDRITEAKCLSLMARQFLELKKGDSAAIMVRQALLIPDRYRLPTVTGDLFTYLGMAAHQQAQYIIAKQAYKQAAEYYRKAHDGTSEAVAYLNIGICEKQLANFREAITYYLRAGAVFVRLKDSSYLARTYNSVALCFVSLKEYKKAIQYNKITLVIRKKINDKQGLTQSLNNLGYAFNAAGQPDSALSFLRRCLAIRIKAGDSAGLVLPLQNIGHALRLKGDWRTSERYIVRSARLARENHLPEEDAKASLDLATIYNYTGQYTKAFRAVDKAIGVARLLRLPELMIDAYGLKALLYAKSGNTERALQLTNLKIAIKDSVFTSEKDKYISELEVQYQTEQRQKDIAALNLRSNLQQKIVLQQRLSIITLIVITLLLLFLFAIAVYNYRLKIKAYAQVKTLMKDLHHRVKNNLQLLSGLFTMQMESSTDELTKTALQQNDSRLAAMNLIHKQLYMEDPTMRIDMRSYLGELTKHIKNAFGSQEITVALALDQVFVSADQAVAIGLIVNELILNAFKYAFSSGEGLITLELTRIEGNMIRLYVADNGNGDISESSKSSGFGLNLVKIMAEQLNAEVLIRRKGGFSYRFKFTA